MMLYVTGMLCFAACAMMSLADIICYIISGGESLVYLLTKVAFALFGLYAFDTAVSAIPSAKELKAEKRAAEGIKIIKNDEEITETEKKETALTADNAAEIPQISADDKEEENIPDQSQQLAEILLQDDKSAENTENKSQEPQEDLAILFEKLAAEKQRDASLEQEDINIFAEETVLAEETSKDTEKYNMLSEIFTEDDTAEVSAVHSDVVFETRSFKKIVEPKLNESAPEYDMLKSMFRGEDTSDFEFNLNETAVKTEKQPKEKAKKQSIFGGAKKEKAPKEKVKEPKAEKENKHQQQVLNTDKKIKFVATESRQTKAKTETKKVVYKKPK